MLSTVGRISHNPKQLIGRTGRRYWFRELLQDRPKFGMVWIASFEREPFVLKHLPQSIHSHFKEELWPVLSPNPSAMLRLPIDEIPDRSTYVYEYMLSDLLQLVRNKISMRARRQILRAALQGIADLHERDIVHLDIKPGNIMVNYEGDQEATTIKDVKLIDLENAAYLPDGRYIEGMLAGNENWRSIEAHFRGPLDKPTDMFSFGLVCLYAIFGRVVCGPDADFEKHQSQGALPAMIRSQRLVSYFGDKDGLDGLIKHVGNEGVNRQILSLLWEERNEEYIPYIPFSEWPESKNDKILQDLIGGLMNLDPGRRFTAADALRHPWFAIEDTSSHG